MKLSGKWIRRETRLAPSVVFFHENPELPREEFSTANKIEKELNSFGLETIRVDITGVYAEIKGCGEGKTIILRADIDALPVEETNGCSFRNKNKGVMHACGHDAHTASLLLAAKILSKHRDEFKGSKTLFSAG